MKGWGRAPGNEPRRQRGAVAVMVGFAIVMLITVLGLVLDLGHLYIVKTEMQNAADACALAAVWEISPYHSTNRDRATEAGKAVGNLNAVNFQSTTPVIGDADIEFSDRADGGFSRNYTPATRYVRCTPSGPAGFSVVMWFMRLWGTQSSSVSASATARMQLCVFPLAICARNADLSDLTPNRWYGGRLEPGKGVTGSYDWIRVGGMSGARALADLVAGYGDCNVPEEGATVDSEPGVDQSVARAWNTRFGLYSAPYREKELYRPDTTGWGYTAFPTPPPDKCPYCASDPSACGGAYEGIAPPGLRNYRTNQSPPYYQPFDSCALTRSLPGNPAPLPAADHQPPPAGVGIVDRRLVVTPVIRCQDWAPNKRDLAVLGWACSLMLSPIPDSDAVMFEFLGLARDSVCAAGGVSRLVR